MSMLAFSQRVLYALSASFLNEKWSPLVFYLPMAVSSSLRWSWYDFQSALALLLFFPLFVSLFFVFKWFSEQYCSLLVLSKAAVFLASWKRRETAFYIVCCCLSAALLQTLLTSRVALSLPLLFFFFPHSLVTRHLKKTSFFDCFVRCGAFQKRSQLSCHR